MRALALSVLLAGCAQTAPFADDPSTSRLADGTPEAVGMLGFLNDPGTTLSILDNAVALDSRAAGNLIAHRDGGDRLYGTSDDDLFDDLAEVDGVRWVGPATIERIAWFATEHGWTPEGDDVLGIWDGVQFTVDEAEATVAFANTAPPDLLDYDLGMDGRAVDAIVEARPIPSVQILSELYYVGTSALITLKEQAVPASPVTEEQFADDLRDALIDVYAEQGDDIIAMGGNDLDSALALVSAAYAWEAADDPYGHDLAEVQVFAHPDTVFPGSDTLWYGAYERATGDLIEVYAFE